MTTWLTADLHFDHVKMAEIRRCPSVGAMNEALVAAWNAAVKPKDDVWVLGDFALGPPDSAARWFKQLHGHKNLVAGNHDSKAVLRLGWERVEQVHRLRGPNGSRIVLCHYPMLVWQGSHQGALHAHGHSHGNLTGDETTRMDVGVDALAHLETFEFPFDLEWLVDELADREPPALDHHRAS